MSVLDKASKHWDQLASQPLLSTTVPEWVDAAGEPTVIYYKKHCTHAQLKLISNVNASVDSVLMTVIARALDAEGNRLFSLDDVDTFTDQVDPNVVAQICIDMGKVEDVDSVDTAKKK